MPLSEKQMKYLALAWQCFDAEPKIDYKKFAQVAGLKSEASARELMRVTKNKLKEEYGALSGAVQSTNVGGNSTPTSGNKRGRKKAANAPPADDEDDEEATPAAKKVRKAPAVKKEQTPPEESDDGGLL